MNTRFVTALFFALIQAQVFGQLKVRGIDFVEISESEFLMGCPTNRPKPWDSYNFSYPEHRVRLSQFWIQKHVVTVRNYCDFLNEVGLKQEFGSHKVLLKQIKIVDGKFIPKENSPFPVGGIAYAGAKAYCNWFERETDYSCRLPTEAEWELVAKGDAGRTYPWGELRTEKWPIWGPVGSRPDLATPDGVWELVGPVVQWCEDFFDRDFYLKSPVDNPVCLSGERRCVRGGATFKHGNLTDERIDSPPTWKRFACSSSDVDETNGFRVVLIKRNHRVK